MDSNDAAIFNAAMSTINNSANIASAQGMNRAKRKWSEKMYAQQRADALADWNMQNEYNHPSAQMARLREAGLNPHLVYGKGADNTSTSVPRSSDVEPWNPETPRFHMDSIVDDYFNFEMKQAQIDNLRVQNTVSTQEAILKAAQTGQTIQATATNKQQAEQAASLFPYSLEATKENIRKTQADTQYTLDQNQRSAVQSAQSIQEGLSRLLSLESSRMTDAKQREKLQQEIDNLKKDANLKQLDFELRKQNIMPGDSWWTRILQSQWERIKKALPDPNKDSMRKKYLDKLEYKPFRFSTP